MKEICPNLHNKQVAKEFGELKDLFGEDTAYLLWSKIMDIVQIRRQMAPTLYYFKACYIELKIDSKH